MISRRRLCAALCVGFASSSAPAHTPFQQWVVYRQKHLLIGTSKTDDEGYQLGKRLAVVFKQHIPNSKSRVARAPNHQRLASLITTDQMLLVLLRENEADNLRSGTGLFNGFEPFDLKRLAKIQNHVLVASPLLLDHHAWLIVQTLANQNLIQQSVSLNKQASIPLHDGALAYFSGKPMPELPEVAQTAGARPND